MIVRELRRDDGGNGVGWSQKSRMSVIVRRSEADSYGRVGGIGGSVISPHSGLRGKSERKVGKSSRSSRSHNFEGVRGE